MDVLKRIENYGVIPVVKIEKAEQALPLAKALCDGELETAEITFRTDCAAEAIAAMHKEYPQMLLGAGTVTTVEQVKAAVEAGADFIVSPCFVEEAVKYCVENDICIMPGCATATEVQMAVSYGLKAVKFFPAEAAGGIEYINSLASVFKGVKFMPTGGVKPWNGKPYVIYLKDDLAGFAIHIEERNDHNPGKWEHRDEVKLYAPAEIEEREALGE